MVWVSLYTSIICRIARGIRPNGLYLTLFLLLSAFLTACDPQNTPTTSEIRVELIDGNVQRTYVYDTPISVAEFLRRVDIEVGDLDRVNPPRFTQITDGLTITIVRVTEERRCEDESFPFQTRRIPTDALDPGVEEISQTGLNGTRQVCQRCIIENGIEVSCSLTSETVIDAGREQVIYYGTGGVDVPLAIEGKLAYIGNGQAYFIEGNLRNRRPITLEGRLDGRVFDLSRDGGRLLFSRLTDSDTDEEFSNELWAILDTANPQPLSLLPNNVLSGMWHPIEPYSLSYSTAEPQSGFPSWSAYNDFYLMRIDSETGETLDFQDIVDVNAIGLYSYWGVNYHWSPDGEKIAWSRADSVGLVDVENGDFITLTNFPHFDPAIAANWVWQPNIHWSDDSRMLITTLHGPPYSTESPVNSVIFDVAVLDTETNRIFDAAIGRAGIWAQPRYSPIRNDAAGFPDYDIAYLQARDPLNSLGGEYDLVIADRDGSNPRAIFPPAGRQGIRPFNEAQATEFVWSPSGGHLAIIYQGNLWIVEAASGLAQQITTDGRASHPRWGG